ncbi:O-antigen ligase family protein [Flavobacterium sp.]|uniref:O-antigen ligase family protein n=1 Tax=Flavobacterium sp. TaxID=239 RepID=UPI003341FD21
MNRQFLLKIKRFSLFLFILSLPFEYWDPFGIASFFSVTKMAGFGYAVSAFLIGKDSFDSSIFKYVRILLYLYVLMLVLNMLNYVGINKVSVFNFTLFQNILLYWLIASDIKKQNIQVNSILLYFIVSIVFMSILLLFGIGIGQEFEENVTRITFFGNNPNTVGVLAGLAIAFSLYFILNPSKTFQKKGLLVLIVIPSFVNLIILSGSRGALISTVIVVLFMFIMKKSTFIKKIIFIGLLVVISNYLIDKVKESDLMFTRLTESLEKGSTAGRSDIWEDVIELWKNRPLLGYGATGFETEMIIIYGSGKDAHNLFLYILVTSGLIGLCIFLYFIILHMKRAINSFIKGDVLIMVLLIFYLTTVLKSGGAINNKLMWLLLAIIISHIFYGLNKIKTL